MRLPARTRPRPALGRSAYRVFQALALALLLATAGCRPDQDALARGHAFWADSAFSEALSEYRLALGRSDGRPDVLALVAHASARADQLNRARDAYARLIRSDSTYVDQAVFDFLGMARRASERGDAHGMASALDAAAELRPGSVPTDLAAQLARYHARAGEPARALELYELALMHAGAEEARDILFELGRLSVEQGNCRAAVGYFDSYRERWPGGPRAGEARWQLGNCAYELAQEAHRAGQLTEALGRLQTVIAIGVPENLQDQAWFDRGEILFALGRDDEALEAYLRVLELNPDRTGQLVDRAQRRIDQIRFGGP